MLNRRRIVTFVSSLCLVLGQQAATVAALDAFSANPTLYYIRALAPVRQVAAATLVGITIIDQCHNWRRRWLW